MPENDDTSSKDDLKTIVSYERLLYLFLVKIKYLINSVYLSNIEADISNDCYFRTTFVIFLIINGEVYHLSLNVVQQLFMHAIFRLFLFLLIYIYKILKQKIPNFTFFLLLSSTNDK
jgi:hypothetical protein